MYGWRRCRAEVLAGEWVADEEKWLAATTATNCRRSREWCSNYSHMWHGKPRKRGESEFRHTALELFSNSSPALVSTQETRYSCLHIFKRFACILVFKRQFLQSLLAFKFLVFVRDNIWIVTEQAMLLWLLAFLFPSTVTVFTVHDVDVAVAASLSPTHNSKKKKKSNWKLMPNSNEVWPAQQVTWCRRQSWAQWCEERHVPQGEGAKGEDHESWHAALCLLHVDHANITVALLHSLFLSFLLPQRLSARRE